MENVKNTIKNYKLIKSGDIVGVAVSGGADSMALLYKLKELSEELDFEVVAIHVDHQIRDNSGDDARFVLDYCKENRIRAYKFKVDAPRIAKERNISLESAARDGRYGVFDALMEKGVVDKVAIAHHTKDQAETILLHLFRGSGLAGAKGMDVKRKGGYIRPLLETTKEEVMAYINENSIPYVNDYTNEENEFSRNYIRNVILPLIEKKWPNVVASLNTFSKACADDDEYINQYVMMDALILEDKTVKIPTNYFVYPSAIVSRLIFKALASINVEKDIERKHIELIKNLALSGENGSKLNLPHNVVVVREYDYITIFNKHKDPVVLNIPFKCGEFEIPEIGTLIVKRVKTRIKPRALYLDYRKVPKTATWRFRQNGDIFEKFGGGTKKLKAYMIDRKIPQRLRSSLPVLADGNEIYAIAGVEISNKALVDNVPTFYMIEII